MGRVCGLLQLSRSSCRSSTAGLSNVWPAGHIVALHVVWNGPRLRLKLLPNYMEIRILIYFTWKQGEKFTFFIICII